MKVEFTNNLNVENWNYILNTTQERTDNLDFSQLSFDKLNLFEKLEANPRYFKSFDEFGILNEMAALTKKRWKPNQTLKIYFFGGQDKRTQRVLDYASLWSNHCSITFQATDTIKEAKIRIAFNPPSSCSYIGTDAICVPINEPTINFGWLTDSLPDINYKQVVLHEFGHALGLIHEHQSPAIKINWKKSFIYDYFYLHHKWSKKIVDINIFQEFENSSTQHSILDSDSIMAYPIPPQFTNGGPVFPQNYVLSKVDEQYIGGLYPKLLHS